MNLSALHANNPLPSAWLQIESLLKVLDPCPEPFTPGDCLRNHIFNVFDVIGMRCFWKPNPAGGIKELIENQWTTLSKRTSKAFNELESDDPLINVIRHDQHLDQEHYWFILNVAPGTHFLFMYDHNPQLEGEKFLAFQLMLKIWANWYLRSEAWIEKSKMEAQLELLQRVNRKLRDSTHLDTLLRDILHESKTLVGAFKGEVYQYDQESDSLKIKWVKGFSPEREESINNGAMNEKFGEVRRGRGLVGRCFESRLIEHEVFFHEDPFQPFAPPKPCTWICVPLLIESEVIGVVSLVNDHGKHIFNTADAAMLEILAVNLSSTLQRAALQELSHKDHLTGLSSRAHFEKLLAQELPRARRYGHPTTLLMVDIDHFKSVNDTYGHQIGDAVLRSVAQILQLGLRQMDTASRYGGEEFAILLPETDPQNAFIVADRLRTAVMQKTILIAEGHRLSVTISIGLAGVPKDQLGTMERLYESADKALYTSKHNGRNCVTIGKYISETKNT
jgi:diguanylate cyclase (GGDEF)-like protein